MRYDSSDHNSPADRKQSVSRVSTLRSDREPASAFGARAALATSARNFLRGFAGERRMQIHAVTQVARLNQCSLDSADRTTREAMAEWRKRSAHEWTISSRQS